MASLVSQHGQSPVSTVSSGNSIVATPNSGSSSGGGNGGSSVRKPTNLDTQLAILRREMVSWISYLIFLGIVQIRLFYAYRFMIGPKDLHDESYWFYSGKACDIET